MNQTSCGFRIGHDAEERCPFMHASWRRTARKRMTNHSGAVAKTSDFQLREPGFESCAAMSNIGQDLLPLHCSRSLGCMNEHLAIDRGGHLGMVW